MIIDREQFLNDLQMVKAGLSSKELLEQSSCLSADTIIHTLEGDFSIRSLIDQGKTEFLVYSCDGEKLRIGKAHSLRKTQSNAEVYQIIFDTGHSIKLTGNHLVMMRDGTYWEASVLKKGDSVMPFNHRSYGGYSWVYSHIDCGRIRSHVWVFEQIHGRPTYGENHIHHKDLNPWNNHPDNLQELAKESHLGLHTKLNPPARMAHVRKIISARMKGNKNGRFAKGIPKPGNRGDLNGMRKNTYKSDPEMVQASLQNHKIVSVTLAGREDVYDLSVDKYHNFAANGIFVHNCFAFLGGTVFTYNDEIACRKECALTIDGAVKADKLLAILDKLPATDKVLEVLENDEGQIEFRGKRKRFALAREAEVLLPIEKIQEEVPKGWGRLPENFGDIINNVKDCVSTDEANHFALTCIHFHPDWIEACDTRQLLRWRARLGHKKAMLMRGSAISHVIGLGMTEISATESWVHFRNAKGLIFSCRKFVEDYPNMDAVLAVKGSPIKLPKGIIEASDRATIFASDTQQGVEAVLSISLKEGRIRIKGMSASGADFYEEVKAITYHGPNMDFVMTPTLLRHITENYHDAQITDNKLKASGGHKDKIGLWDYVTVLGKPRKEEPAPVPAEPTGDEEQSTKESPED
jgi:hypothetical protein